MGGRKIGRKGEREGGREFFQRSMNDGQGGRTNERGELVGVGEKEGGKG